jgi:putative transposase
MKKNIEEKNTGKEILELLQDKYELNSAQDLSFALKDLFKDALQQMMNAEFDTAMGYSKYDKTSEKTNYRNGSTKKTLKSEFGEFEFETPRDRNGEFEPKIVPKNKRDVSGIEDKIISLYGRGLTTREINEQIQDLYGIDVSATMISNITDQIIPEIKEWQERPLDDVYPIVFIDAVHFSVRDENRVVKKAAYVVLGITKDGYKEIVGVYIGENESSKFWLGVLNDLKQRGVKDILIMCSDNLTGIKEAINAAFPNTVQQRCIVHMIRNSVKFVSYKDLKTFCSDLKTIYNSKDEKQAYDELQKIKEKWKDKYLSAFKTWEDNWDAICPFFQFSEPIRKIMYTTNTIESLNRQFRKYTKTKSVFPTDMSLLKCLYLSTKNIQKKWTQPYRNWGPILSELSIMFDGRI